MAGPVLAAEGLVLEHGGRALNPEVRTDFYRLIAEQGRRGTTIALVSHYVGAMERQATCWSSTAWSNSPAALKAASVHRSISKTKGSIPMATGLETILGLLAYDFMQRALVVGVILGVNCGLLGVFLSLRNFSLIGDGLALALLVSITIPISERTC